MDYLQQYQLWRGQNLPQAHAAELEAMEKDKLWMEGAFGAELQFGTAGMRGIMGMGTTGSTATRCAGRRRAWQPGCQPPVLRPAVPSAMIPGTTPGSLLRSAQWPWPNRASRPGSMPSLPRRRCCLLPSGNWAAAAASSSLPLTMPAHITASSATAPTAAR